MAQLTYDELRLLRQLERGDQVISNNNLTAASTDWSIKDT
jgi:hypothetical protein